MDIKIKKIKDGHYECSYKETTWGFATEAEVLAYVKDVLMTEKNIGKPDVERLPRAVDPKEAFHERDNFYGDDE